MPQRGHIDILRAFRRPVSGPTEYYQRPHTYALTVGTTAIPLSPGANRLPAVTLLLQADLSNLGIISIGDSSVTTGSGIQLDSGKAALFAPSLSPSQQPGSLGTGISSWIEEIPIDYRLEFVRSLGTSLGIGNPVRIVIDIRDFHVVATLAAQTIRVFWVESVRIPARGE